MVKYRVKTDIFADINKGEVLEVARDGLVHNEQYLGFDITCIERNPGWFEKVEPEIKVGDWVWFTYGGTNIEGSGNALIRIGKNKNVGFGHFGSWVDDYASIASRMSDFHRKATDDEVGQALIEEAKRRGFGPGVGIKTIDGYKYYSRSGEYKYNPMRDILYYDHVAICVQGNWAEIIEDEWEVGWHGISGISLLSSVESGLAHMCVKKGDKEITFQGMTPEQAEAIAEKLNELDR